MNKHRKDIVYVYTVQIRKSDGEGWTQTTIEATSMTEVSRLLQKPMDDLLYVTKGIAR